MRCLARLICTQRSKKQSDTARRTLGESGRKQKRETEARKQRERERASEVGKEIKEGKKEGLKEASREVGREGRDGGRKEGESSKHMIMGELCFSKPKQRKHVDQSQYQQEPQEQGLGRMLRTVPEGVARSLPSCH